MRKLFLLAVLGFALAAAQLGPDAEKMGVLPGCPLTVPAYSGYLDVTATKKLHYVFIGSLNLTTDPVVVWFNGGPGCSSLEGLFQEHGPCVITDGETEIKANPFSWNKRANMLYIESPAGVGYSIADGEGDNV